MFTFRSSPSQSFHSHRLLYLHSSDRDREIVKTVPRFKTQSDEETMSKVRSTVCMTEGRRTNKSSNFSSKNKIHYFDLDLKSLVNSDSCRSTLPKKGCQLGDKRNKWQFQELTNELISYAGMRDFQRSKNRVEDKAKICKNKTFFDGCIEQQKFQKNTHNVKMLDLLDKQNIEDLWKPMQDQVKKKKKLQGNCLQIGSKYYKIKQGQLKKAPNLIKPAALKPKGSNSKSPINEFCLKKMQKILSDSQGNEYRITIQKV